MMHDSARIRREAEHVTKIRQALQDKKLVIIIGAGIPLSAIHPSPHRLTWTGLISEGLDYLKDEGFVAADDVDLDYYRGVLQRGNTNIRNMLRVCGYLKDELDHNKQFATWLESVFGPLHREVTHPEIFRVFSQFHRRGARLLTTNYDDLLEQLCGLQRVRHTIPEDVRKFEQGILDGVFHIHGSFQDPKEVVLDSFSYYHVKTSDEVQNLLKTYLAYNTILFVGCGSGLEDPNFTALLEWATSREENIPYHHYLLVRDGDNLRYNPLITLKYGQNYEDLVPYLSGLLDDPVDAFTDDTLVGGEFSNMSDSGVNDLADMIREDIVTREVDKMKRDTHEIISWLAPVRPGVDQANFSMIRAPGSGEWFFDSTFRDWLINSERTKRVLWLTGKCKIVYPIYVYCAYD